MRWSNVPKEPHHLAVTSNQQYWTMPELWESMEHSLGYTNDEPPKLLRFLAFSTDRHD
jgi:hypothetical protein